MPPSRHGRQSTFSKPILMIFWATLVGVVGVTALSSEALALRLATLGSLCLSLMIWSVYRPAVFEARLETQHERTLHARSNGEAAEQRRTVEREVVALRARVGQLEHELLTAREAVVTAIQAARHAGDDMWADMSEAPTVVHFANRREQRAADAVKAEADASVRSDERRAETA